MTKKIRTSDLTLLSAIIPISQWIPATLITENPTYLKLVGMVPDWFFWGSLGFAVAAWGLDPWRKQSRIRDGWKWATDKFVVERIYVGNWMDESGEMMPRTDTGVRMHVRFLKTVRPARLRLRIFQIVGQGRKPRESIIDLSRDEIVAGEALAIPIVTAGQPSPGWDHTRARGWGPEPKETLIGGSMNVAVLECEGRFVTQRHKVFIRRVTNLSDHPAPHIFVLDEDHDLFDLAPDSKSGEWAYQSE